MEPPSDPLSTDSAALSVPFLPPPLSTTLSTTTSALSVPPPPPPLSTATSAGNLSPTTTHHSLSTTTTSPSTTTTASKSEVAAKGQSEGDDTTTSPSTTEEGDDPATAFRSFYYMNLYSLLFALPTIRALLCDFEDSNKGRACALLWKAFMFVAISFSSFSVCIRKLALTLGVSRLVAIELVLLLFLVMVFVLSRIHFCDSFIEEKNKSGLWEIDPRNIRWIVDCCCYCFKGLILILLLWAATLLGVYGEEGDLYGSIAMVFLTLSLISYEVKYRKFPCLPVCVVSSLSVIVILRKSLPRSLKQFFPETSPAASVPPIPQVPVQVPPVQVQVPPVQVLVPLTTPASRQDQDQDQDHVA